MPPQGPPRRQGLVQLRRRRVPITGIQADPLRKVRLTLNNADRFTQDNTGSYFRTVQPYQHRSNVPRPSCTHTRCALSRVREPLWKLQFQPRGQKRLILEFDTEFKAADGASEGVEDVIVFARNWNVLRITGSRRQGLRQLSAPHFIPIASQSHSPSPTSFFFVHRLNGRLKTKRRATSAPC